MGAASFTPIDAPQSLAPDRTIIRSFLVEVIATDIHLVAIGTKDKATITARWFGNDANAAADWAMQYNADFQCGVYWTVNICKSGLHKKPEGGKDDPDRMGDMIGHRFLHVDIDPPKGGGPWSIASAAEQLTALQYPPSFTIASGGGLGAFWRLDETACDKRTVTEINRSLAQSLGGDHCHNHDRVMRLPGTVNWPDARKIARGRVPALAFLLEPDDGVVYPLHALAAEWPPCQDNPSSHSRESSAPADFELITANDLGLGPLHPLRSLIDHPAGRDRSIDAFACAGAMHRAGLHDTQIMGVLMNPANAVSGHILDQRDPRYQAARILGNSRPSESPEARRLEQRKANVEIGEGCDEVPTAQLCSLDQMLEQFVFIRDGSQVAPLDRPQAVLALADFRNAMAGSKHPVEDEGGKVKMMPTTRLWLENMHRKEAEALTFRAGAQPMTREPDSGRAALNLWRPIERPAPPANWQDRATLFTDHIAWLWGDEAEPFLDWLAHIEQRPGVLPHYGWVHISREHGKGRNWISSALVRLWRGHTAASLDLVAILEGGFNGRMSRKLLAIVDEINEGGNTSYRHAQTLRQIVTAEHREINPKYGRQRVEWNACRWLMFSNHTGAIPLGEDDRRFWIVSHTGEPREPTYYSALYDALSDPLFIISVAEFLRQRDISDFKPGQRPPMTEAKAELIAFGQTEDEVTLAEIVKKWPVDIITAYELNGLLEDGGPSRPAVRHAMDRVGMRKIDCRVRVDGQGSQRCHAVRNYPKWRAAAYDQLKDEIGRVKTLNEKRTAIARGFEE